MKNNRSSIMNRLLGLLLSAMLLTGMFPASAIAAEKGSFILVAEAGEQLVIAPEYIEYEDGQSIGAALIQSGHVFTGIEDGWITEIDGVVGNYSRSDENGGFDLNAKAEGISFLRFCEDEENSQPSAGLQQLMTAMADYQKKDADVKSAAKAAYDTAVKQFVGLDSDSAKVLAEDLNKAISQYESEQNGIKNTITFSDGNKSYTDADITVESTHGKVWSDDGDGILELPAGEYMFHISRDGLEVTGNISVKGNMTVTAALPQQLWLKRDSFRVSGSYGDDDNEDIKFTDDEYTVGEWNGRNVSVAVEDTFTGKIYTYAEYDDALLTETPTLTAIYTSADTGKEINKKIPFESLTSGMSDVLKKGAAGNQVTYRISRTGNDGYTYAQDYTVAFKRVPTLQNIVVTDVNGVGQAANTQFKPDLKEYTYKVLDSVKTINIEAVPSDESYSVKINDNDAANGVTVELNGETVIPIVVTAGNYSNTYNLKICPGEGLDLSFVTDRADITLEVVNKNGEVMPFAKFREGNSSNRYQYTLIPGETYNYVATCDTYYHIADEFTMEDVAGATIRVDVPTESWLTELAFGMDTGSKYKNSLPMDKAFKAEEHKYKVDYTDTEHNAYVWVTASNEFIGSNGVEIEAIYDQKFTSALYHGKSRSVKLTSGAASGAQLKRFLMQENPVENTVTIRLSKEADGITYYQDYPVEFKRSLTLQNISAKCDGRTAPLVQEDGTVGFAPLKKEYSIIVSMAAQSLDLSVERYTDNFCYGEDEVGYRVKVDGVDVTSAEVAEIGLNGTMETQNVTVTVENDKAPEGTSEYIFHIMKSPPVKADFEVSPANALLAMYETKSGERIWPDEDGVFPLCEGYSYDYMLTAYGYIGKTGTLAVTRNQNKALVVEDGQGVYKVTENADGSGVLNVKWELDKAEKNTSIKTDMESEWPDFRGNEDNNGVTDAAIPAAAEDGTLYWANKIGKGYSSDAVGSPILVDGDLVTYAGSNIYRVDTVTGAIKVTGQMDHKSAHATTPPAYSEGMIFVAQTDGTIQAFNAETLESLWIYKDPLGGQPVCPMTIKNGYLYTGFWNSETGDANFVCVSITDENPAKTDEKKNISWYHTATGGYYWAGAYVSDDFVLIGTDDGTTRCTGQSSSLLMFDPVTGMLLDSWDNLNGDIRSSIVYDRATDAYYFTSKGGAFYSVQVTKTNGEWKLTNKWKTDLDNGTEGTPMSTCSPSVYNGRAYVGVSGEGQFSAYSGHNITVIDLKSKSVAYRVATQGYPQTSGLLTTAYEEKSGYVYVYFFDNMTPGKLRVLRDKPGQKKADYITTENGQDTAYDIFTPTGDHAQYAICSPIVDEYGTIYFKNDSAHLMAFGSKIEKIEVTNKPEKMVYSDGEEFDPKGMVVTATYSNGKTRDVTAYVKYDLEKITEKNTTVTISFPYVMYHNQENGTGMTSGVTSATPVTTLEVSVGKYEPPVERQEGDINNDGDVDQNDAKIIVSYYYGDVKLTNEQIVLADVNGDGEIDTNDAGLIISYYHGSVTQFH